MRRYYLAGPMTGLPEYNYPAFEEAASRLRRRGRDVCSPHELFMETPHTRGSKPSWHYINEGVKALITCTDIVMLDGWTDSEGACLEHKVAIGIGLAVYHYRPITRSPLTLVLPGRRDVHKHARDH